VRACSSSRPAFSSASAAADSPSDLLWSALQQGDGAQRHPDRRSCAVGAGERKGLLGGVSGFRGAPERSQRVRPAIVDGEEGDWVKLGACEDLARRFSVGGGLDGTALGKAQPRASAQHLRTDRVMLGLVDGELVKQRLRVVRRAAVEQHLDEVKGEHHEDHGVAHGVVVQLKRVATVALGARQITAQRANCQPRPQSVSHDALGAALLS